MAESTETEEAVVETTTEQTTTETETDPAKELAKWKALSRKNEKAAKETQAELEKLRTASMSEQEKAVAQAREEGKAEAATAIQLERVRDKIEAKAGGKLADPEDAAALLGDLSRFVQDDGTIDTAGIAEAIDNLVKTKPYLSAQPGNGSGEGGPRGSTQDAALNSDPLQRDLERKLGIRS